MGQLLILKLSEYILYFAWANQKVPPVLYPLYTCSTVYVRHALYGTARDNGDSFSLSYSPLLGGCYMFIVAL